MTKNTTTIGKIENAPKLENNMTQTKPAKIFKRLCPDIIFANNRIARLRTLAKNEINSITTKNGATTIGTPGGKKNPTTLALCSKIAKIVTPKKNWKDKKKVRTTELVSVKL